MRGNVPTRSYDLLKINLLSKLEIRLAEKQFSYPPKTFLVGCFFLIPYNIFIKDHEEVVFTIIKKFFGRYCQLDVL